MIMKLNDIKYRLECKEALYIVQKSIWMNLPSGKKNAVGKWYMNEHVLYSKSHPYDKRCDSKRPGQWKLTTAQSYRLGHYPKFLAICQNCGTLGTRIYVRKIRSTVPLAHFSSFLENQL